MSRKLTSLSIVAVCLGFALSHVAFAQEPFYKDKIVRFVVGYSAGGSFDLYTRMIARHFGRHVPGNPTRSEERRVGKECRL